MPEKVCVTVTQAHIDSGERKSSSSCPIAQACVGMGYDDVTVDDTLLLDGIEYKLPTEASRFIEDFDDGMEVAPFTFCADPYPNQDDEEPDMSAEAE